MGGGGLSAVERSALDAVDETALIEDLVQLVRVPSVTGTDAESDLQARCAGQLVQLGLDVDAWRLDLDMVRAAPGFPGMEVPRTEGYGVVGTTEGQGPPALVLQGHVDVVPTGDLARWAGVDPFCGSIQGRALRGRGACDMKAGVAANVAVVRALRSAGFTFERPLAIHCVVGEEDGGVGAFATMLRGHRGEAAVITEPTSGTVVTAAAGALTFRIEIAGRAAHGSTRTAGFSAFEAFFPIHRALRVLESARNRGRDRLFAGNDLPYAVSIGMVRSGDWSSSVPDRLVADGRLGVRLDEDPRDARAAFERAVAAAASRDGWLRDHPPVVTWPGGQFASGRIDPNHPLVAEIAGSVADSTGRPSPPIAAVPYGSDLRLYAAAGIPTLHYGPGDVRLAHAPREEVDLDELIEVTRSLVVLAVRRCGARR